MLSRLWAVISFPLIFIVFATVISAILLGIGTLLTFLFAVSVWEATTVVVAVTAGLYWVTSGPGPPYLAEPYPEDLIGDEEEPRITISDIPFRSGRGRRRRRR